MTGQKGVSIIVLAFIIAIIAFLGLVFVSLFTTSTEESTMEYNSDRALFIAQGGADAAIEHTSQGGSNWLWNEGYLNKSLGDGTVDVEVLQYVNKDGTSNSPRDETFLSCLRSTGANPARTVYITLFWNNTDSGSANYNSNDLGLELYQGAMPGGTLLASSTTSNNPEIIRFRLTPGTTGTSCTTDTTYTVRVLGNSNSKQYYLRISHPDENGFAATKWRSVLSLGKMNNAKREVFAAFKK